MNLRTAVLSIAASSALAFTAGAAFQEAKKPQEKGAKPEAAAMPAPAKPGPHHARISKIAGTWDVEVETMMQPGAPPQKSKGVETNTTAGNGLWTILDYKGEMMGQPFHGHGIAGYDSTKKKHVGVWADSMADFLAVSEGECDGTCRVETLWAEMPDPMTGKPAKYKEIHEWKDEDTRQFSMSTTGPDGKDMVLFRATYRRRK